MRNFTRASFAFAGGLALVAGTAVSASAATGAPADTTTTVAVTAGDLTIAAPATLALSSAAPGATASGTLGTVSVSDLTADSVGWSATATISDFVDDAGTPADTTDDLTIPAANFSYTPTGVTKDSGTATVTGDDSTDTVTATAVTGNNAASWGADVTLTIPSDALAAANYTATLTHSVL